MNLVQFLDELTVMKQWADVTVPIFTPLMEVHHQERDPMKRNYFTNTYSVEAHFGGARKPL